MRKWALLLLALVVAGSGCSIRKLAINGLADSLAAAGDSFASDDDPDLIRDALPFALKTMESLLVEVPRNRGLLLATCKGFTEYAYAFLQVDADLVEPGDPGRARRLRQRALGLFLRARDYGLQALELDRPGISERLLTSPDAAAETVPPQDLPVLYWTAAAWGSAISLGRDRPALAADTDAVRAMMRRALALDESFDEGAIHTAMITLESLPAAMGGSLDRAREHYERALELSGGRQAGVFVTMAEHVAVAEQDRQEFEDLLHRALAVDLDAEPGVRLANVIFQRKARALLDRAEELFL